MMMTSDKTPIQRVYELLENNQVSDLLELKESLIKAEKKFLVDAIMYALDEDGHTGDWKIKFAENYYLNQTPK